VIEQSYTMLTRIPLYRAADGLYTDDLWEKDLSAHLRYIPDFRIACPVLPIGDAQGPVKRIAGLRDDKVTSLRVDGGWGSVAANFLPNFLSVRRAMTGSTIVHTSCAGWAFPLAYYALFLRPFMRFKWVNVVESSFWVKPATGPVSMRQQIEHHVHEFLVRRCVRASDARIFTQDGYRAAYLGSHEAATVNTAVWIDDESFRDAADLAPPETTRLIFPARLLPEKGVDTVLSAVERWDAFYGGESGPVVELDIIGEGSLAEKCRAFVAARDPAARLRMRFLDQVPYGAAFFGLLRGYSAAIVANRQAEQARIVFDVMAQGLPVLASDTTGNRAVVDDGRTGAIFPVDDADALAALIERAARDSAWLAALGRKALAAARGYSHSAMHRDREAFLHKTLALGETVLVSPPRTA
jgi:glycosyltransferase involved in cell wall biosynthesis